MTIFGAPWSALDLATVSAFLAQADDEPLLWEAKGTKLDKSEVRLQVCAFANSHEGGFLILGAARASGGAGWTLDGMQFPDEPITWITNVVADPERGVRPRPDFDVLAWRAQNGHVAIVRVSPTPTPPCMANGTLYERLPGKSQTVRDPTRLAELFAKGDLARRTTQERADRAALAVLRDWLEAEPGVFRERGRQREPWTKTHQTSRNRQHRPRSGSLSALRQRGTRPTSPHAYSRLTSLSGSGTSFWTARADSLPASTRIRRIPSRGLRRH
ncbi:AlbA family DNA-binding domain-containing protein [Solirubrobacter phytolaccae]|uniref:AlbA family DNA-binding domain-containing protein n=1 Tax=Solirubrobacter phytolaccae TaxID=1404360 RepID=UPI003555D8D6